MLYDSTLADAWYELSYLHTDQPEKRLEYLFKALQLQEYWLYRSHILATLQQNIKDDDRMLDFLTRSITLYENEYPNHQSTLKGYYKARAAIYGRQQRLDFQKADLARANRFDLKLSKPLEYSNIPKLPLKLAYTKGLI
ncbi:MAG: hypothetical protein RLZZ337_1365 [Bacteroidota bacterium]